MTGESSIVKAHFQSSISDFNYTYCRNPWPALCFVYLTPKYENFQKFDSPLLDLSLLFKIQFIKLINFWRSAEFLWFLWIDKALKYCYSLFFGRYSESNKCTANCSTRFNPTTVLQGSIQPEVENLVKVLNTKSRASQKQTSCFFSQVISLIRVIKNRYSGNTGQSSRSVHLCWEPSYTRTHSSLPCIKI